MEVKIYIVVFFHENLVFYKGEDLYCGPFSWELKSFTAVKDYYFLFHENWSFSHSWKSVFFVLFVMTPTKCTFLTITRLVLTTNQTTHYHDPERVTYFLFYIDANFGMEDIWKPITLFRVTRVLAQAVTSLKYTWEVPGFNLSGYIYYISWDFL
jgi:hypothetical protein